MLARQIAFLVLALLLTGSLVLAQGVSKFRPFSHLEQWDELCDGEYGDLFEQESFLELKGRKLSAKELAEVRTRWAAERQRVELLVAAIKSDPHELAVRELLQELEEHPYIGQIDYTRVDGFEPFVFMVQRPPKDKPGYAKNVAEFYGPWFRKIESIYSKEFVEPLELKRRPKTPYVIFVLATKGAYADMADALHASGLNDSRAHYNAQLQIAITYRDSFGSERKKNQTERHAAMHELVHAMQHAHSVDRKALPANPWLVEGLADYLSAHDQVSPGILQEHYSDINSLKMLVGMAQSKPLEQALLFPLEEIVTLKSYEHVVQACLARAKQVGRVAVDYEQLSLGVLFAPSGLWAHFMRHGMSGRYRERYDKMVGEVQHGKLVEDAFAQAFEGLDLAKLDREYRKHVNREAKTRLRNSNLPKLASQPFRMGGQAVEANSSARSNVTFNPANLLPEEGNSEVEFAMAIGVAAQGSFGAAQELMAKLVASAQGDWKQRASQELKYLDELVAKRLGFLEHLKATGSKLKLKKGSPAIAKIKSIENGIIHLERNPRGSDEIALDAIDSVELADLMLTKKYRFKSGLAPSYIYMLAGDKRWEKAAKAQGAGAADLLKRGVSEYAETLALAEEALLLRGFAELGVPEDLTYAQATFESVSKLYRSESKLIKQRRSALESYASATLREVFRQGGVSLALAGNVTLLGKNRLRVSYPFRDAAELGDFKDCVEGRGTPDPYGQFELNAGVASAEGNKCMAHLLPFSGPQIIRFSYRLRMPPGLLEVKYLFSIGFNTDADGYSVSFNHSGLSAVDRDGHQESAATKLPPLEKLTKVELHYDGKRFVDVLINGKQSGRLDCGPRKSGTFYVHADGNVAFEISELSLEGTVSDEDAQGLCDAWIAAKLRKAGMQ